MAKTNQNKNNSSKITNPSLFTFNNSVDIMLKIDFNQVSDISQEIVRCKNAISKLQKLAKKLSNINHSNVEVSITLFEEKEPEKDIYGKHNVVESPIFMIGSPDDIRNLPIYTSPKKEAEHFKINTITEDGIPPELALIMFDSMKKYYQNRLVVLLENFVSEIDNGI